MTEPDTAGVIARPPFVFGASILLGLGADRIWPVDAVATVVAPLGAFFVALAIALFCWSLASFKRAGTPVQTSRPTASLVTTGPYSLSRNPIYTAFTLLQLGLGMWINALWLLVLLVPAVALIRRGVILREERYLERRLGEAYLRYKARVPRW